MNTIFLLSPCLLSLAAWVVVILLLWCWVHLWNRKWFSLIWLALLTAIPVLFINGSINAANFTKAGAQSPACISEMDFKRAWDAYAREHVVGSSLDSSMWRDFALRNFSSHPYVPGELVTSEPILQQAVEQEYAGHAAALHFMEEYRAAKRSRLGTPRLDAAQLAGISAAANAVIHTYAQLAYGDAAREAVPQFLIYAAGAFLLAMAAGAVLGVLDIDTMPLTRTRS